MRTKRNLTQIWLLCAAMLPAVVQAQFNYTITNGTITITSYFGTNTVVSIPDTINVDGTNLSVTSIGDGAFQYCFGLTSVTIPNSVTTIGDDAFSEFGGLTSLMIPSSVTNIGIEAFLYCGLTNVTIPNSVTSIGNEALYGCTSLTHATIGTNVTNIGGAAFGGCGLTSVTMPNSVTNISDGAFAGCLSLTSVYFQGNSPSLGAMVFDYPSRQDPIWPILVYDPATIYYLPGTTGWGTNYGASWDGVGFFPGLPTALWVPQIQTSIPIFGVKTNQFGFNITWASGLTVVVEASTSLVNPNWSRVATNTLDQNGLSYFSDPAWTNYPSRFYRIRSP